MNNWIVQCTMCIVNRKNMATNFANVSSSRKIKNLKWLHPNVNDAKDLPNIQILIFPSPFFLMSFLYIKLTLALAKVVLYANAKFKATKKNSNNYIKVLPNMIK